MVSMSTGKFQKRLLPFTVMCLLLALIAAACAQPTPSFQTINDEITTGKTVRETIVVEKEVAVEKVVVATAAPAQSYPGSVVQTSNVPPSQTDRKIIKNADLELLVQDTDVALDRLTAIATDFRGYVLSTRTWFEGQTKVATINFAVPVDSFETALRQVRAAGLRVLQENASGQDVSAEYVDLQSQIRNLEATADRVREFLTKATTVEEALKVNAQLSDLEGQIESLKGRLQYLQDRSAYSTITVSIRPEVPTPTATSSPTATPTLTPTATATPKAWNPAGTFHQASGTLGSILKIIGDLVIWVGVIILPMLLPIAALIWFISWLRHRSQKQPELQTKTKDEQEQA